MPPHWASLPRAQTSSESVFEVTFSRFLNMELSQHDQIKEGQSRTKHMMRRLFDSTLVSAVGAIIRLVKQSFIFLYIPYNCDLLRWLAGCSDKQTDVEAVKPEEPAFLNFFMFTHICSVGTIPSLSSLLGCITW